LKHLYLVVFFSLGFCLTALSQNSIQLNAVFNAQLKTVKIQQNLQFTNSTNDTLQVIYLQDWTNSYADKNSPLAVRFAEEFKNTFHFAKDADRGFTDLLSITQDNSALEFKRLEPQIDIIKVVLENPVLPNSSYQLNLEYTLQIQNDKFTRYGINGNGEFHLRHWYIVPAVYNGEWQYFSNKDLDDQYVLPYDITFNATFPSEFKAISELDMVNTTEGNGFKTLQLKGENRINTKFSLVKTDEFSTTETDFYNIQSNLDTEDLPIEEVAVINDKVAQYLTNNLGEYPHEKLLLSYIDYKKEPIYGLNLLPDFIRPFPDSFQYELKILKTSLRNYLENTLLINPRKDQWILDGIQTYYLMKYVEENYPDTKILGALANFWGVRAFHASDLKFNEQYNFLYMHMARQALDQPLTMAKDSLLKFNKNISNKYKAGVGLNYLNAYEGNQTVDKAIERFVKTEKLTPVSTETFKTYIEEVTSKDQSWFFNDYIGTNNKIDYKIKDVDVKGDSLKVTIRNLRTSKMPISFYTIKNDSIVSKSWLEGFSGTKTFYIPNENQDHFALNFDNTIPEFNTRNNWESLNSWFNKPLQFRLFKDIEDPNYNQVFFMPEVDYNFYDGVALGLKLYNKTILSKRFLYRFSPSYGFKSKQIVGSGSLIYNLITEDDDNYYTRFGFSGEYFNYAPNLSYYSYNPYVSFNFRNKDDYRDNYKRRLVFRYVTVSREVDPTGEFETEGEPKYSVFNASYGESDPNLKNFFSWNTDFQLAKDFGKISATLEYRKLSENNRQFNVRLFAGSFLYNNTFQDSDFFSFALDRPTDYLFDYNYLGRSEETGLLSQQIIVSEGGFKSKLNTPFANQWITTANSSLTIWRYIMAYGDVGFVDNRFNDPKFVYDSGIRLNLVEDYFELYFPVYSNLGWEVGEANYSERIRFIVTLSPKTLLGLFTRRWY
jgi:hypothetical protein